MPTLLDSLSIGATSLSAQQLGLQITGHNISNAGTEGYSRQSLIFEPLGGAAQGVRPGGIRRASDQFLSNQLGAQAGNYGQASARASVLDRLEETAGNLGEFGLGANLDRFYSAWRGLAGAAHDEFERVDALSATQDLANAIRRTAEDFRSAQVNADKEVVRGVTQANELIDEIASLNRSIQEDEAYGDIASEMRDRRDLLAQRLGKLAGANSFVNSKGHMIVTLSGGMAVVSGVQSQKLEARLDTATGFHNVVMENSTNISVNDVMMSGQIKGYLSVRDTDIGSRLSELDTFAHDLVTAANAIHRGNFNLNGVDNVDLFTPIGTVAGAAFAIEVNEDLVGDPDLLAASSTATGIPGDGIGAQAMADLESATVAAGNTQTLSASVNRLFTNLGYSVREALESQDRQGQRFEQLQLLRESTSGVSIEEEMVQLSRYQRSFQAASKIIQTVDEMLELMVQL